MRRFIKQIKEALDVKFDEVKAKLDDLKTTIIDKFKNVIASLVGADLTVAQNITINLDGRTTLSIYAIADAATTFTLEMSDTSTFDLITYKKEYATVTTVSDIFTTGWQYARFKSAAAGVAGNKVTLKLSGSR